ncbi:MAG: 5-(carboxyamino)imidazole ribonucleotide mutase [Eubacteriales bacterium]|nr:5-(carboxyamino)imidazole ribonucleotide mutase [Eubacteriales bacterium]
MKKVAVVMGSASDLPLAKDALKTLAAFGVPHVARVLSAHRTPDEAAAFAKGAEADEIGVIIAFAGKAAHLAGAMAANSVVPVIGVPVCGKDLGGLDALLSTVQMPKGVPVATVGIDGAANAALLAVRMLALSDEELNQKLKLYVQKLAEQSAEADEAMQKEMEQL